HLHKTHSRRAGIGARIVFTWYDPHRVAPPPARRPFAMKTRSLEWLVVLLALPYPLRADGPPHTVWTHGGLGQLESAQLFDHGQKLATRGNYSSLAIWNADNGAFISSYLDPNGTNSVAANAQTFATGSQDDADPNNPMAVVEAWRLSDGEHLRSIPV